MYEIVFSESAKNTFEALHKNLQQDIVEKLRKVSKNPKKELLKLRSNKYYYFRVSAYRVIVDL